MRKKMIGIVVSLLMVIGASFTFTGCTMSKEQVKIIANQSGIVAAVSWIGIDNPSSEIKDQVKLIINELESNLGKVSNGQSYAVALQDVLVQIVESKVEEQYKSLTIMGGNSILTGIDLLLAMYPSVAKNEQTTVEIVHQFFLGAKTGLSLNDESRVMKAVRPGYTYRSMQLKAMTK